MQQRSRRVESSQFDVHRELRARAERHRVHAWQRPVPDHARLAFDPCAERVAAHRGPLILDAGCGTGTSALGLALREPSALVIGVDKSEARLGRGLVHGRGEELPENLILVRADLVDFWRLARAARWQLSRHCLFYPNPWPKPGHLARRWQAHPVLPDLLALGGTLELRSNWDVYVREWVAALAIHGRESEIRRIDPADDEPVSPFERKYLASGHACWQCVAPARS